MIGTQPIGFDTLGVTASKGGVTFPAIRDDDFATPHAIEGYKITLTRHRSQGPAIAKGDVVTVEGVDYVAVAVEPDGPRQTERIRLSLSLAPQGGIIERRRPHLDDSWLSELFPSFPMAVYQDEQIDPTLTYMDSAAGDRRRPIFNVSPLDLPPGSTVLSAELWVYGVEDASSLWTAYLLVKSAIPGQATWLQFRSGQPWALPGASSPTLDHDATVVLGSGAEILEGWHPILSGPTFTQWVHDRQNTTLGILFIPTTGAARWFSGHVNNVTTPYLRVEWGA